MLGDFFEAIGRFFHKTSGHPASNGIGDNAVFSIGKAMENHF
jgi:hypothetical protein